LITELVGPGGGPRTLSMASDIRDNEVEAVLEMSGWRVERLGTGGIPVDADDRWSASIAPVKIVQAQTVDHQERTVRLRVSRHRPSLSRYLMAWQVARKHSQALASIRNRRITCKSCPAEAALSRMYTWHLLRMREPTYAERVLHQPLQASTMRGREQGQRNAWSTPRRSSRGRQEETALCLQ
jgi:hypothetical protein